MRACKDWFEGVGDEAELEAAAAAQEEGDRAARAVGWDDDDLQDVQERAFLAVRDLSRETGVLAGMRADHWVELCERFTPSPHLHEKACTVTHRRATWPPAVTG